MRCLLWLLPAVLLMPGCNDDGEAYMPLSMHKKWSYLVDDGVNKMPDHVKVTRQVPVGSAQGFELTGELGISRFAWQNGRLITDDLSNTRFMPPLPILATRDRRVHWRGWVFSGNKQEPAYADVDFVKVKKDGDFIDSTVTLKVDQRQMSLVTRFQADYGIVRQEQRTGDQLDLSLMALSRS